MSRLRYRGVDWTRGIDTSESDHFAISNNVVLGTVRIGWLLIRAETSGSEQHSWRTLSVTGTVGSTASPADRRRIALSIATSRSSTTAARTAVSLDARHQARHRPLSLDDLGIVSALERCRCVQRG